MEAGALYFKALQDPVSMSLHAHYAIAMHALILAPPLFWLIYKDEKRKRLSFLREKRHSF